MEHSPWDPEDVELKLAPNGELMGDACADDLDARHLYKQLVAARSLDMKLAGLELPMWASGSGEEAVGVCVGLLSGAEEWIYPGARDVSVATSRGVAVEEIGRQALGRRDAEHFGRVRPGPVSSVAHCISTVSSALGMHLALAAGHAHATKLCRLAQSTVVIFGEGLTTTGVFHETIALATSCELPLVMVCKSQVWPDGAPSEAGLLGDTVAERGRTCGIWTRRVDGADPLAVHHATAQAIGRARDGNGPSLVEVVVSPLRQDPPPHRDPIERLRRYLDANGQWTQTFQDVIEAEFNSAFDTAIAMREPIP
ncbi:MAG: thiamine pyrophosphate-dependent enzyme [Nannocystaceae bacterium]